MRQPLDDVRGLNGMEIRARRVDPLVALRCE